MLYASLILNILVLIPVCTLLLVDSPRAAVFWGERTPARSILTALYLTILVGSIAFLFIPQPEFVVVLLAIQVFYKLLPLPLVGTLRHPVVLSNLAIAAVHIVAITTLLPQL
mgnify:CR=1 FL=1